MRIVFLVLIGFSLAAAQPSVEEQILSVVTAQQQAWNDGDLEGYMEGYWNSNETTFISGGTVVKGYQEVFSRYQKRYDVREKMGVLSFKELQVRMISAETAMVTGIWRLHRANDSPWGRFTLLVERKPEGWRVTYDHTSVALQ